MRLVSSRESLRHGDPSVLAIIETIVASGLSVWLAWKQSTVEHIVIASALAPVVLLRTGMSTRYTIFVARRIYEHRSNECWRAILPTIIPFIKIFCSARVATKRPIYSISQIPNNYYRNIFQLDLFISPSLVYGSEEFTTAQNKFIYGSDVYNIMRNLFNFMIKIDSNKKGLAILAIIIYMLIIVTPPIVLRLTIKSTALLWLPLLWLIQRSKPGTLVLDRIKLNIIAPWSKVMLVYSIFVLVGFCLKMFWLFEVQSLDLAGWGPLGLLAIRMVAPLDLPIWQVACAINAVFAWLFFFRGKQHLLAKDSCEAWPVPWVEREYVAYQAIRTTLSLYIIACTFYIAATTAWTTEWPPIHFILFPWTVSRSP